MVSVPHIFNSILIHFYISPFTTESPQGCVVRHSTIIYTEYFKIGKKEGKELKGREGDDRGMEPKTPN